MYSRQRERLALLTAAERCNSFFKAAGLAGDVTRLYTHFARQFEEVVRSVHARVEQDVQESGGRVIKFRCDRMRAKAGGITASGFGLMWRRRMVFVVDDCPFELWRAFRASPLGSIYGVRFCDCHQESLVEDKVEPGVATFDAFCWCGWE